MERCRGAGSTKWRAQLNLDFAQTGASRGNSRAALSTLADFLWVACPKVAAGGVQLLVNLLLMRRLGPERSGIVFVLLTAIVLCDGIFGIAVDMAVVRLVTGGAGPQTAEALSVQKTALVAKWIACLVLAIPAIAWSGNLSALLFSSPAEASLFGIAALAVAGVLTLRSVQTYLQVNGRFAQYGSAEALHGLLKFGGMAALAWAGMATPVRVLWFAAAGPAVVAAAYLLGACRPLLAAPSTRSGARGLLTVAPWYLGGAAAGSITSRMDLLLLSSQAGAAQAGIFSGAQNLTVPFQLIGQYLGVVFTPRILPLWKSGRLARVYWSFQAALLALCLVLFGVFSATIGWVIPALLPASFQGSAAVAQWLAAAALAALLNFPWTVSLLLFTYPRSLLVLDAVAIPILVMLYTNAIGHSGAIGAAMISSGYAIFKTVIFHAFALRALRGPRPAG